MAGHEAIAILYLFVKEVNWDPLVTLAWNRLTGPQDLYTSNAVEECLGIHLECIDLVFVEAVLVRQKQVNLVLARSYPLNVTISFLVVLEALIRLLVPLEPVSGVEDSLWLEDLLSVSRHVGSHGVLREVGLRADSQISCLLGHDRLDILVLYHARGVLKRKSFSNVIDLGTICCLFHCTCDLLLHGLFELVEHVVDF